MASRSNAKRFGIGAALALVTLHAHAGAEPSARVILIAPRPSAPLVEEAIVRAQGELSAVGLSAEVGRAPRGPRLPQDVYGSLELIEGGTRVTIVARAPRSQHTIIAEVDLTAPGVTAEVIAVRAVETLRAAMLEFAQSERGQVPAEVRGFTRFEPEPEPPAPPPPPHPLAPPLAFWLGPSLSFHAGAAPDLGVQLGVLVGRQYGFAAASFETTTTGSKLDAPQGSATVSRRALWAQVGARFRPARAWEITTRAGAGYASFEIEGEPRHRYRGERTQHGSLALMLGVSGAYWATQAFGVYGGVGFRMATDAPSVRIAGRVLTTFDRPAFVASLGTTVGIF